MGYMKHNAIVVSSWNEKHIKDARISAINIFGVGLVSEIINSKMNGYLSFFVAPDGSKEGWDESNQGDTNRQKFIKEIDVEDFYVDWAEVSFGGDEANIAHLVNHNGKV